MIKHLSVPITLSILLLSSPVPAAETRYVTDILKLSMHEQTGTKGKRLGKVSSGDKLSVLSREGNYAKIKTKAGKVGWVKSAFLTKKKPARAKLNELESQLADGEATVVDLKTRLLQQEALTASATEATKSLKAELHSQTQQMQMLSIEKLELKAADKTRTNLFPLKWAGIAAFVTLLIGFGGGTWWADYRLRQRHGGFRVY